MVNYRNLRTKEIWTGGPIMTEDGMIFNPTEEQLLNNGYREEVVVERTAQSTLEDIRQQLIMDTENYYKSNAVSGVYINGTLDWIPAEDRVKYLIHIRSMINMGKNNYTVSIKGLNLTLDQAMDALDKINCYAVECYMVFMNHLEKIKKMTTSYDLETYDFTADYPQQLELMI